MTKFINNYNEGDMMDCSATGVRICPQCKYEIKDNEAVRCPRCFKILLLKCSECKKCNLA
jgi:predicted amidophosphoribosyltransferase